MCVPSAISFHEINVHPSGSLSEFPSKSFRSVSPPLRGTQDRKSTRLNSSHANISYAVFCLKKKNAPVESSHDHPLEHDSEQHHGDECERHVDGERESALHRLGRRVPYHHHQLAMVKVDDVH